MKKIFDLVLRVTVLWQFDPYIAVFQTHRFAALLCADPMYMWLLSSSKTMSVTKSKSRKNSLNSRTATYQWTLHLLLCLPVSAGESRFIVTRKMWSPQYLGRFFLRRRYLVSLATERLAWIIYNRLIPLEAFLRQKRQSSAGTIQNSLMLILLFSCWCLLPLAKLLCIYWYIKHIS